MPGSTIPRANVRELELRSSPTKLYDALNLLTALHREQQVTNDLMRPTAALGTAGIDAFSTGAVALRGADGGQTP